MSSTAGSVHNLLHCQVPAGTTNPFRTAFPASTGAPDNVIGLHLVDKGLGLTVAFDIVETADQDIELAGLVLTELLESLHLLLITDDASYCPGPL